MVFLKWNALGGRACNIMFTVVDPTARLISLSAACKETRSDFGRTHRLSGHQMASYNFKSANLAQKIGMHMRQGRSATHISQLSESNKPADRV